MKLCGGTSACALWIVANTKPPPGASASRLRRTSVAHLLRRSCGQTRVGYPRRRPRRPHHRRIRASARAGPCPAALFCTGLRMSMPASIRSPISGRTAPQLWNRILTCGAARLMAANSRDVTRLDESSIHCRREEQSVLPRHIVRLNDHIHQVTDFGQHPLPVGYVFISVMRSMTYSARSGRRWKSV